MQKGAEEKLTESLVEYIVEWVREDQALPRASQQLHHRENLAAEIHRYAAAIEDARRAVPFEQAAFSKALRTTVREIDRRDHHDGLVPIGKVRHELAHLHLDRPTFDAALLEEERAYTVDLKIANDPTRVKEPEAGISCEGRGLLYFVVVR